MKSRRLPCQLRHLHRLLISNQWTSSGAFSACQGLFRHLIQPRTHVLRLRFLLVSPQDTAQACSPWADDGTAVRGKFGTRFSGHGIGTRHLEHHALARVGQNSIQEQIEQIDKACERINNGPERNHLRQLPQFPTIDSELHRHVIRAQRERGGRISGLDRSRDNNETEPPGSPPIPPANSPSRVRSPILSNNTFDDSMVGFSDLRSGASSMRNVRMREPGSPSMRMREPG